MARAFYSEFDPYAAATLRNLIAAGEIADGDVDERNLWDVCPDELRGYTQVHLCAGLGLWSYALRRAAWPDDRPIWTASFPCQPFSAAGKGLGFDDERHLWPAGVHLISQCRPSVICGEQVASKDGYAWRDLVQTDMEGLGYAFWAVVLPIAGVGGPGERHRQWWVGMDRPAGARFEGWQVEGPENTARDDAWLRVLDEGCGFGRVAGAPEFGCGAGPRRDGAATGIGGGVAEHDRPLCGLADGTGERCRETGPTDPTGRYAIVPADGGSGSGGLDAAKRARLEGFAGNGDGATGREITNGPIAATGVPYGLENAAPQRLQGVDIDRPHEQAGGRGFLPAGPSGDISELDDGGWPGPLNGFWRNADWLFCTDGRWRPVEPGTFPLAYGLPASMGKIGAGLARLCAVAGVDRDSLRRAKEYRIGMLKAYGNAISPEPAIAFIESWRDLAP